MARVFSQKHSSTFVGNVGIYIVSVEIVCIRYDKLAKQNVSREGLTRETLAKTSCHHPFLTLRIPVMCWAHASLRRKASRELPGKTSCSSLCLEFSHSLTHTQPLQETPHKIQGT